MSEDSCQLLAYHYVGGESSAHTCRRYVELQQSLRVAEIWRQLHP